MYSEYPILFWLAIIALVLAIAYLVRRL